MSKHRPHTKGYLIEHVERGEPMLLVGAEDLSDKLNPYRGPMAEITWDETWLNIVTDKYEGRVMLNIETLPHLRRALAKIERKLKTSSAKAGN